MSQLSLEARILAVYRARSRKNFFFLFVFLPKEEEKLQEMIQNEEVGGKKYLCFTWKISKIFF